ncbi:hypothetical protein [Thermosipho melanesiensis]|nr:hypothetical protein [Thermosipho melanesiensis]
MFGNISFFKLLFILLKSIPKTLLESFFIFFSKSEEVLFLDYKDDFDMLVKILSITLTPKTIAFDHDEKYLYIHKMGD